MIDFEHLNKALKCVWIKRFTNVNGGAVEINSHDATVHLGGILIPVAMQQQS